MIGKKESLNTVFRIETVMAAISVNGLTKIFGNLRALDNVSFTVEEGTFFGCFGPNGAGKTTLLRILSGQIPPTSGQAYVLGMDVRECPKEIRKAVGLVPEMESPPSFLTAYEFLLFVASVRGLDDPQSRIEHWMTFFDLEGERNALCKDLSKGTRQKLMLVAAFIHEPPLLFLDEPFINLDPVYQRKLREYLLKLKDGGRTIFMCSHILEIAEKLCEEVLILSRGRVRGHLKLSDIEKSGESLETVFLRCIGESDVAAP